MSDLMIMSWCPGAACDPCQSACLGSLYQGRFTDSTDVKSVLNLTIRLSCPTDLLALPSAAFPVPTGYGQYFTDLTNQEMYKSLVESLTGHWVTTVAFDGTTVLTQTTDIYYISNGQTGIAEQWHLVETINSSPSLVDFTFTTGSQTITEKGAPYDATPSDVAPTNHVFIWQITGNYQEIGGTSLHPAAVARAQRFYGVPQIVIFQP